MKVGFIGVGNMGGPMCRNIIRKNGEQVIVFDLNADAIKVCTDLGATAAKSVAELVAASDVVMTSLPMPKDVEAVALGPGGILESGRKGLVYFDLSTNSPTVAKRIHERMQEKGIIMLDAPVSGGVTGAEAGTIAIMVGGDKATFDKYTPLLQSFGANVLHLGVVGSGCIAKLINNMLSFCNMTAAAEGLVLGTMAGLDGTMLEKVVSNSSGNSNAFRNLASKGLNRNFKTQFALDLAYKDLRLCLELAEECGVPMMMGPQVLNMMRMARAAGWGQADSSSVLRVYENVMTHEIKSS